MPATTRDLVQTLRHHAADPGLRRLLDRHETERTWRRLGATDDLELWLISWPPGSSTDWHDHGVASGAFTVLAGSLVEHAWDGALRLTDVVPGRTRAFGPGHVHDVRNEQGTAALSLHAYAPRLEHMTRYRFLGDRVEALAVETAGAW